ncbi:MAG TPA: RagB/SusD family nutrient uptake outer membrane protein [Gemmatimonadaceae bacterium]|nr:RagB/SusD family nutrient uptake outer membrane protein [Gemmatimonadaceae bacterium]
MRIRKTLYSVVSGLILAGSHGCRLLEVSNPGPISDEALNNTTALPGLVTGMSFDLSRAVDAVTQEVAIMADELFHGGSYAAEGLFNRGIIREEDVNGMWGAMHRARWVAESGIQRIRNVLGAGFDSSPLAARAYIYAGLANRLLGENVCNAVFDGGPSQPYTEHFVRAEAHFSEAIRIAGNLTGALRDSLLRVAYGGRASVRAWQGKWSDAVTDAQQVPTGYVFYALFSTNTPAENNDLVFETNNRLEYTVYNTQWAQVFRDPRVPWDTVKTSGGAIQNGQDGRTPFFRQKKYVGLGADIPMVKGTEMLMLRAEAALRSNDVAGAMALINQQRAFYSTTAQPLPPLSASTVAEAWPILQKERAAVLWLEARRFWDLRRWNTEPPPIKSTYLDNRDKCIPISRNERLSNPNLRGT